MTEIYSKSEIPADLQQYFVSAEIGLEETPVAYVERLVAVFREVRRVLTQDGTCWVNLGDTYAANRSYQVTDQKHKDVGNKEGSKVPLGLKGKDLMGIPWRVAFALQADGWYLRQDIIWQKPNPMPESVKDRCTKAHEYIFMLTKSAKYWYDADAIAEPAVHAGDSRHLRSDATQGAREFKQDGHGRRHKGFNSRYFSGKPQAETRNKRSVWPITTKPYSAAHFATFPPELPELCIKAGCPPDGTVLDPFGGAGTTGMVADRLGRDAILIELNPVYAALAEERIHADAGLFAKVAL